MADHAIAAGTGLPRLNWKSTVGEGRVRAMTNDDVREDRVGAIVNAFLQNKSMEQKRDYLARGRRFARLDVAQLKKGWIIAVRNWLARKNHANELMMDDLASEMGLRRLEPPYQAVAQELIDRFAQTEESMRNEELGEVAREISEFMAESTRSAARS
jgi:hypothetical protein